MNKITLIRLTVLAVVFSTFSFVYSQEQDEKFPATDKLKENIHLPDPFTFFDGKRSVNTLAEWKERQNEMLELLCHYIYGPYCPPLNKYKIIKLEKKLLKEEKIIEYSAEIGIGKDQETPYTFTYYLPNDSSKAHSILIFIDQKPKYTLEQAASVLEKGFGYCSLGVGSGEKAANATYPNMNATRTMGWVFGVNEMINFLVNEHKIDKVILGGCSRYGRTAIIAGAINKRIDMVAPVTTLAHAVRFYSESFTGKGNNKWSIPAYDDFKNKVNHLPLDRHFWGALIAPRPYLFIMGEEKDYFMQGHIEAHDALLPVYKWLGAEKNLALYDHAPRGHGYEFEDQLTILNFADHIFNGKKLQNPDAFYKNNTGPVRLGKNDQDNTKGWQLPSEKN